MLDNNGPKTRIIFVYNADTGLFNKITDSVHKLLSPGTYKCNLCALTHSAIGMKNDWRDFLENLDIPLEFLHRDEYENKYAADTGMPAILIYNHNSPEPELRINSDEINNCKNLSQLKSLLQTKLNTCLQTLN